MSRVSRTFSQQHRLGGVVAFGPEPPQAVLPLPTLAMQTVTIRGVAVKVRVAYPRRFVKHYLFPPLSPKVSADVVSGSAAASGTVAEAAVFADTQQASASPSGSLSEFTRTGIGQPFIEVMFAGNRRGRVALRAPLVVTSTNSSSDVTSGAASPSGTLTQALTHSPSLSGAASPSGSLTSLFNTGQKVAVLVVQLASGRRNVQTSLRPPAVVSVSGVQVSDITAGSAAPSGSIAWAEIHVAAVSGSASPSGFAADSFAVGPLVARPISVVSLAVALSRSYRWSRRVESLVLAPATIDPAALPLESQRTLVRKLAGATRAGFRRRQTRHFLSNPYPVGLAVYGDTVFGTAPAASGSVVQSLTHTGSVAGSASASGSVVQAKVYVEAVSGSAAATGSRVDAKIGSDTVTGTSSATGSSSDQYQFGAISSDNPVGAASPSGTRVESLTGTNTVAGVAAAFGSMVERKLYPETVFGTSTATGFFVVSSHLYPDAPFGVNVTATGTIAAENFNAIVFPVGFSSATGHVVERSVEGFGDTTVSWRILRVKSRWTAKVRG